MDDAVLNFQKALAIDPKSLTALNNMAIALTDIGKSEEAISTYEKMLEIHDDFSIRIKQAMTLPVIYPSTDAMRDCRRKFLPHSLKPFRKQDGRSTIRTMKLAYPTSCLHCMALTKGQYGS